MAIGPIVLHKSRERIRARAEKVIDQAIKDALSASVTVDITLLHGLVVQDWNDILAPKYRKAGWRVAKWIEDAMEGDYIELRS